MHAWEEALELRSDMEAYWRSPLGERFSRGWRAVSVDDPHAGATLHIIEQTKFQMATPVFVNPDMHDLWQHAQKDFPGESVEEDDLPIPAGFVVLPKPWIVKDRVGDEFKLSAFAWLRVRIGDEPGVHLSFYQRTRDEDPGIKETLTLEGTPLSLFHAMSLSFGQDYTKVDAWSSALGHEIMEEHIAETVETLRGIQAFWRLSWQAIGKPYHLETSRPVRKRFGRRWKDRPIPLVTVIALRPYKQGGPKPHEHDGTEEAVEWSHRWLVGGHWRMQWYGSLGMHRAIYIAPHVKGPDDKPLVLKDKVYGWVR